MEHYERPEVEIIKFDSTSVILTSGDSGRKGRNPWEGEWDNPFAGADNTNQGMMA